MYAPVILVGPTGGGGSWSELGTSTTTEMPMYQTSYAFNHTVTSGSDILVLGVVTYDPGYVSAVTCGGSAMTLAADTYVGGYLENFRAQIWYISSPASGTQSISMTFTEQITDLVAGASNFSGIATTSPVRDYSTGGGISTSPSVSVDGAQAGDLVLGVICANLSTLSTSDTEDWEEYHDADNMIGGGAYKTATGASVTISWTTANTDWGVVCVAFKLQ
jgi:hypothetical protein